MKSALDERISIDAALRRMESIVQELSVDEEQREVVKARLARLRDEYQAERMGYLEYQQRRAHLLQGRTEKHWKEYSSSSSYALYKELEKLLSQLFYAVYTDKPQAATQMQPLPPRPAPKEQALRATPRAEPQKSAFEEKLVALRNLMARPAAPSQDAKPPKEQRVDIEYPRVEQVSAEIEAVKKEAEKRKSVSAKGLAKVERQQRREAEKQEKKQKDAARHAEKPKHHFRVPHLSLTPLIDALRHVDWSILKPHFVPEKKQLQTTPPGEKKKLRILPLIRGQKKVKPSAKERAAYLSEVSKMESEPRDTGNVALQGGAGIGFGAFSVARLMKRVLGRFEEKQEPIVGAHTTIPPQFGRLREQRMQLLRRQQESGFDSTLLAQEAKRVKKILEAERPTGYTGSSLGLIANVTVKKLSLALVDKFPQLFTALYNAIRQANIRVLSNTYVNIMVFVSLGLVGLSAFLLLFVFFYLNYPLYEVFLRTIIFSLLAGIASATIFYMYPFMRIKERRRSILTNMPFAINHLSSVASSGVPPQTMFELISKSGEYGQVAIELKKVVDYTNVFGYDFLTAVRAVSAMTPSIPFKEFLDGLVSTIETGGDLDSFLRQKADESTLTYQLERQRYSETVSTYSDVYTGVVIAAPLFFVAALALVNLLGGTIGGFSVDIVLALGAYVGIPLLNLLFLGFLEINQPEV